MEIHESNSYERSSRPSTPLHIFFLMTMNKKGHAFHGLPGGRKDRIDAYGISPEVGMHFAGGAELSPGGKSPASVEINIFHCSYAHANGQ